MCVSKNAAFSECATRTHSAMEETPSSTSLASYVFHPPLSLYLPLPRLLFSYSCSSLARSLSCSFLSFLSSSSISILVSFPFFLPFLFPILPSYSSSPISSSLLFFLIFIALLLPCLSLYSSFLPFFPRPLRIVPHDVICKCPKTGTIIASDIQISFLMLLFFGRPSAMAICFLQIFFSCSRITHQNEGKEKGI